MNAVLNAVGTTALPGRKLLLILSSLFLFACSSQMSGKASYYSSKFQGKKTASGETYNEWHLTAAHKKLPLGSKVKVTNLANGKSVVVKINDRGPYAKGRVIDLSLGAFTKIARTKDGLIDVELELLN